MHRCGGDKQKVLARRRVEHLVGNTVTAAVVNTEMVFSVSGASQHVALGERCFVKAARGILVELDVCDDNAGESAI